MESQHFIGKVAQKALIQKDNKILLVRGMGDTLWDFPGGRLHKNERPKDGLAREIKEEMNLNVEVKRPFYTTTFIHTKSGHPQILISYLAIITGNPNITLDNEELEEYKWVTPEELKTWPLYDDQREMADAFLKQK